MGDVNLEFREKKSKNEWMSMKRMKKKQQNMPDIKSHLLLWLPLLW